jgi:hypothetical protein
LDAGALGYFVHALRCRNVAQRFKQGIAPARRVGFFHRYMQIFVGKVGIVPQQFDHAFIEGA